MAPRFHIFPNGEGRFGIQLAAQSRSPSGAAGQPRSACRSGINPMPGATSGFASLRDALLALRCLLFVESRCGHSVGSEGFDAQRWWDLFWRCSGHTQRRRDWHRRLYAELGLRARRGVGRAGRHQFLVAAELSSSREPSPGRGLGQLAGPQGQPRGASSPGAGAGWTGETSAAAAGSA